MQLSQISYMDSYRIRVQKSYDKLSCKKFLIFKKQNKNIISIGMHVKSAS